MRRVRSESRAICIAAAIRPRQAIRPMRGPFWLKEGKPDPQAVHVGFVAKDHAEVDAFYKAALAAGGKSKKPPQARPEYYPGYYATWVLDPDGHDIEVVHKS
jgi:catechol 2,3-dioxygenase-like lactoylglutathione lyase family enzyme